ncbi:hypothetical protein ACE193_06725 [Bernardetia sp. OM2101]|uniref:hypothetical protein n=1 Tax=Bernardetia sp. OM2101 TaxID=3344876 RepID=UPI0035CF00B2
MKKRKLNKSTLLLAFFAVALWCFYLWKEKENQAFIEETQGIIIDFNEKIRRSNYFNDNVQRARGSWADSIGFVDKLPKFSIEDIPKEYNNYLKAINDFETEFFYARRYYENFKYNVLYRKKCLSEIEKQFQHIIKYSDFEKADLHKVNWQETNDETIWLDLVQQRKEVIQVVDSIFEENEKQFPTSYVSNSFEGYSTLIPNYEAQKMLIKVYWFPSDTKYYTDYGKTRRKYISIDYRFFQFGDSLYDEVANPRTYHIFNQKTDTVLFPIFPKERLKKMDKFDKNQFKVPFKIISKKLSK